MPMAMMKIRVVRMCVGQFTMPMDMRMRFTGRICGRMGMLMMLVMPVQMFVIQRFVMVQMDVSFGQMEPDAKHHQSTSDPE